MKLKPRRPQNLQEQVSRDRTEVLEASILRVTGSFKNNKPKTLNYKIMPRILVSKIYQEKSCFLAQFFLKEVVYFFLEGLRNGYRCST